MQLSIRVVIFSSLVNQDQILSNVLKYVLLEITLLTITAHAARAETSRPEAFYKSSVQGGLLQEIVILYTDGTLIQLTESTVYDARKVSLTSDEHDQLRLALQRLSLQKHIEYVKNTADTADCPEFYFWYDPDGKSNFIVAGYGRVPSRYSELASKLSNNTHRLRSVEWKSEKIGMVLEPGPVVAIYADWPKRSAALSSGYREEKIETVQEISNSLLRRRVRFIKDRGKFWYVKSVQALLPEAELMENVRERVNTFLKNRNLAGSLEHTHQTNKRAELFLKGQSEHCFGVDSNRSKIGR